ncbi:molybdate ABC transporter substrate-binding protein [Roseibium aggregatum]|uniref:Molybdate ABC transporter substrate-binding protein n=1 Tax=Roseibium aggregatum TaxID=187304 RepID=A0A926S857_9HYPH|nr:molybdate ABC transporter substrate-binding protein [Roseibium aggregatum]MBD1549085.1 molybdate ABC transporter substrate-binding protein [Roseibium aggregatum]
MFRFSGRFPRNLLGIAMAAAVGLGAMAGPALADRITVFAAASMTDALKRIGSAYTDKTGTEVVFSFAGTGALARQVEAGAPADVFVSADEAWMAYVNKAGAVKPDSIRPIAANSLVLVGPASADPLALEPKALAGRLDGNRLAIADTETVPAGRYGKAALQATGLWDTVADNLAPMDNVRVALASVARGDTPLGVVYGSDAHIEPKVRVLAVFPANSHPAIVYPAALTKNAGDGARGFLDFLTGPDAQAIFTDSGFTGVGG